MSRAPLRVGIGAPRSTCRTPQASAWSWPLRGDVLRPYSLGPDPYAAGQHRGVDVAGSAGETVWAPAAGTISFVGVVPSSGRTVTIQTDGYAVSLTHLGETTIAKGAAVAEGDVVGVAGQSGDAEWPTPYVHLGIRVSSAADGYVDPATLLPPRAVVPPPPVAAAPVVAATPAPVVAPITSTTPPSVPRRLPEPHRARPWARPPRLLRQRPRALPGTRSTATATAPASAATIAAAPLEPAGSKAGAASPGGGHNVPRSVAAMRYRRPRRTRRARRPARTLLRSSRARLLVTRGQMRTAPRRRRAVGSDGARPRFRTSATSVLRRACPRCVGVARGGWRPRSRRRRRKYAAERSTELRAEPSVGLIAGPVRRGRARG